MACGVQKLGSRGEPVVVNEAAEAVAALDVGSRREDEAELPCSGVGRFEVERTVRPMAVVVVDEDPEDALEVASAASRDTRSRRYGRGARRSRSPSALAPVSG